MVSLFFIIKKPREGIFGKNKLIREHCKGFRFCLRGSTPREYFMLSNRDNQAKESSMTKNPYKLYRASREAQFRWIKKHPFQYVALNATLLGVWIWYIERKDRKEFGEPKNENEIKN